MERRLNVIQLSRGSQTARSCIRCERAQLHPLSQAAKFHLQGRVHKVFLFSFFPSSLTLLIFALLSLESPGVMGNKCLLPVPAHSSSHVASKEASHFECLCPTRQDNGLRRCCLNYCLIGRPEIKSCLSLCQVCTLFFS